MMINDEIQREIQKMPVLTTNNMPQYGADLQIHIHCPGRPRIWRSLRMTARPPGLPAAPHPSQDRHGGCSTLGDSPNGNAGPGAPVTTQHCREPYCLGICGEWHLDFSILCEYCEGIQLLWALLQTSNHSSSQSVNQVNIVFSFFLFRAPAGSACNISQSFENFRDEIEHLTCPVANSLQLYLRTRRQHRTYTLCGRVTVCVSPLEARTGAPRGAPAKCP